MFDHVWSVMNYILKSDSNEIVTKTLLLDG